MPTKILLDTDIGSDIDGAVCLAYLLAQPKCELLGITTVSGEVEKRAMIASVICKVAKRNIPILPGIESPLLTPQLQPIAEQAKALNKWPHERKFPQGHALEFLRNEIRKNPGEITLLAIGPLTNIALLFRMDPEIPRLLKGFVAMCGVHTNRLPGVGPREWNALCDPYATAMVYKTHVKSHRSIPLDVTCRVVMDADEVKRKFQTKLLRPVLDFAQVWFEDKDTITFHDPLAAAVIFDGKICTFTRGRVDVELLSDRFRGATHLTPDAKKGAHEVALEVDSRRFFEHYFSVFE